MREHRHVVTCAVATANGFAMPYRTRHSSQPDEDDVAAQELVMRKPTFDGVLRTSGKRYEGGQILRRVAPAGNRTTVHQFPSMRLPTMAIVCW